MLMAGYVAESWLAEVMFRLAVEACPNGMAMIDSDGKMVMVNSEVESQFGYAREELLGQPVDMLVPARLRNQHIHHRKQYIQQPVTEKPETRRIGAGRELLGLRKDGSEFPVEIGLNPIRTGEHLLVLCVIVDISQRKRMEQLKEEFVSTVSHELRTPLTSIAGSLGLLVSQWTASLPESAGRLLAIAHKNSQRLVRLVNDILDIEKIESGRVVFNFTRIAARSIVEQAIEDNRGFAVGYGVGVRLDPDSVEGEVNVDPDRLSQVVTNLVSNAIKFSPPAEEVLVGVEKRGDRIRITVRDHGPGVPEHFKPRIFGKFAQADGTISKEKGGTGLGLSIVKQIVERLGGTVGFNDALGGGAVFHVDLPIWDDSAGGEIDVDREPSATRVLLCDDDRAVSAVIRARLRSAGFSIDFAHTPETAVARAEATRYAAVLVDLRLRQRDGIDLILRMRAMPNYRDTPILVLSGDPEHGRTDVRSSQLGVLAWLGKPINFKRLIELLRSATTVRARARPRILHIDDDYDVLALVTHALRPTADVVSVDSLDSARRVLATDHIDLVILDIALGTASGLELLPDLRNTRGAPIPVIVFGTAGVGAGFDGQIDVECPKSGTTLDDLVTVVRDRLTHLTPHPALEAACP